MTKSVRKGIAPILLLVATFTFILGAASAMNIFKNDFEKRWPELSQDVNKLNEYTKTHPVELRDTKTEGLDLEGVVFSGSTFSGVEWENVDASKAILTKVVFRKCKFIGGQWKKTTLTDVVFEDCEFVGTSFNRATVTGVRFKNCKIERTGIGYLTGGKVEFDGCNWHSGVAGDSSCEFVFKNCTLRAVSLSMMKNNVPILFEGGLLDEIGFYGSHFSTVTLRRVKQGEGGAKFNDISFSSFKVEDSELGEGIGLANSVGETFIVENSLLGNIAMEGAKIEEIWFRGSDLQFVDFEDTIIDSVKADNCTLFKPGLWNGFISEFSLTNSTLNQMLGKNFKADIVMWDNVTLDGKIDLTNAQVKDFRPSRIKRGPNLQLITTGSNMKF